jgi:phosphoribosylformylglycinamidine synthase
MDYEKRVQAAIRQAIEEGLAESSHDLADGGLAVALAECSFENGIGASVELDSNLRAEFLLFGEAPSRILVSASDPSRIQSIAAEHRVTALEVGDTIEGKIVIRNRHTPLMTCDVLKMRQIWASALEGRIRR